MIEAQKSEVSEKPCLEGMKVLLVDDTPANIDVLRKTLAEEGYEISVAPNGEVALKIAPRFLPDLILLDIMMPGIDGFETCRLLKQEETTRSIPVIFISAKNESEDIVQGFELGGVDYINKPFRQEEVLARVRTHLNLRYLLQEQEKSKEKIKKFSVDLFKKKKELEESLKNFKAAQKKLIVSEKLSGLGRLCESLCDEIMNPVNVISGQVQALLVEKEGDTELIENLQSIQEEVQRIEKVVNGLLKFASDGELNTDEVNLREELELLISDLEKEKSLGNIKVNQSFQTELPSLSLDKNLMHQAFQNIIDNAKKAMGEEGTLTISAETLDLRNDAKSDINGKVVRVKISDTGPGIDPVHLEKIFNPFYTLSKENSEAVGLGLSICQSILEKHGGTIKAESDGESGTTIVLDLPVTGS